MHSSALNNCKKFVSKYLDPEKQAHILDVGSYDFNGSLKPCFHNPHWVYVGCDKGEGKNVDVVLKDAELPWDRNTFDCVVSSSCLEHDPLFWLTFKEMVRVCRAGGFVYLCVPSSGPYHGYPKDYWRFNRDAYEALGEWCSDVELIESYIDPSNRKWQDNVGVFKKKYE